MKLRHDGVDLFYEVHGDGAPILLVHGCPLSSALWHEVLPLLPGRLIVPDLRGMGRSQPSPRTTVTTCANDLLAVLDHIEERRPVTAVGMSMGGATVTDSATWPNP